MRLLPVRCPRLLRSGGGVWIVALALLAMALAPAQARDLDDLLAAVVRVKATIEPDGRTVATLGREREGSGVLIDTEGLVLTIGYLMVEARSAEIGLQDGRTIPPSVVGYDHETGFGLLRAIVPPKVPPRPDPLVEVTAQLRAWFDADPSRTGCELLERLQVEHPGCYPDHLLRTLQRRLKVWRGEMARALVFGSAGSPPLDPVQATAFAPA